MQYKLIFFKIHEVSLTKIRKLKLYSVIMPHPSSFLPTDVSRQRRNLPRGLLGHQFDPALLDSLDILEGNVNFRFILSQLN